MKSPIKEEDQKKKKKIHFINTKLRNKKQKP
jgi:hypothetical protein